MKQQFEWIYVLFPHFATVYPKCQPPHRDRFRYGGQFGHGLAIFSSLPSFLLSSVVFVRLNFFFSLTRMLNFDLVKLHKLYQHIHQHTNTPTHQNTYKLEFGDGISLITLITQIKLLFADAKIELTSNLIKTSSEMWL